MKDLPLLLLVLQLRLRLRLQVVMIPPVLAIPKVPIPKYRETKVLRMMGRVRISRLLRVDLRMSVFCY